MRNGRQLSILNSTYGCTVGCQLLSRPRQTLTISLAKAITWLIFVGKRQESQGHIEDQPEPTKIVLKNGRGHACEKEHSCTRQ